MPGKFKTSIQEVGFPVACLGVTLSNQIVVGGGGGTGRSGVKNKLAVYKIAQGQLEHQGELELSSDEDAPTCLATHPTAKTMFIAGINRGADSIKQGNNKSCRVFEIKKTNKIQTKHGVSAQAITSRSQYDYQRCMAIDKSGKLVACGATDGTLAMLKYPSLKPAIEDARFIGAADEINDVSFNQRGNWLAVSTDQELKVLLAKDGSVVQTIDKPHTQQSGQKMAFRFARFGSIGDKQDVLYTVMNTVGGKEKRQAYIAIWDTENWARVMTRPASRSSAITTLAVSHDRKLLAFATASLQMVVCDAQTLQVLGRIPHSHSFAITALAFDQTGRYLISGSADETCQVLTIPDQWPTALDTVLEHWQLVLTVLAAVVAILIVVFSQL